jgi:hypothetical protein
LATFCLFEPFIVCCEVLLREQEERKDEARPATFFWARLLQQQISTQQD